MSIPEELRPAVDLRGYVPDEELRRTYCESSALLLLSDFEAFGLPIIEALASGTPVFVTHDRVAESLFDGLAGVHLCTPGDVQGTADRIATVLQRGVTSVAEVLQDGDRLRARFDAGRVAVWRWNALAAAWSTTRLVPA